MVKDKGHHTNYPVESYEVAFNDFVERLGYGRDVPKGIAFKELAFWDSIWESLETNMERPGWFWRL